MSTTFQTIEDLSGTLAQAYGSHVVSGTVVQKLTSGVGDNAQTYLIVFLGEGPWNRIVTAYWAGGELDVNDYHFHNGYLSSSMADSTFGNNPKTGLDEWTQGVDPWNVGGQTFSGTAYVIVKLPLGVTGDDDFSELKFICECLRVPNFDSSGNQIDKDGTIRATPTQPLDETYFTYSTNPARIAADLVLVQRNLPRTRIDWAKWVTWRNFCDVVITWEGGHVAGRPTYQNITGLQLGADSALVKTASTSWGNAGAATTASIASGVAGFFEADFGTGLSFIGLTTDTSPLSRDDFMLGLQFNDNTPNVYLRANGVELGLIANWVTGDRFRVAIEGGVWHVYKNGIEIDITGFSLPTPSYPLYGGFSAYTSGGEILRATMNPANASVSTGERTRKRFECGLAFPNQTDIAAALNAVLYVSCSEMQDADGKLMFIPPTMSSAPKTSVFSFDASNILPKTFKTYRLARDQRPTKLSGKFRDLDSPTLSEESVSIDRDALVGLLGRENPAPEIFLGTMTRGQAQCVLSFHLRKQSDLDLYASFDSVGTSWKVLPADVVDITEDTTDWLNVDFEVIEAVDNASVDNPDTRKFLCQLFNDSTYSDTDQTPLSANVTSLTTTSNDIPNTPTGFTANLLLNSVVYKWDKPSAQEYAIIREYEIWSSTDTNNPANRLWHGLADGWAEAFVNGAPNSITRYLRAVSHLGRVSGFASITQNLDTVAAPSNYTIVYDGHVAHHSWSPSVPAIGVVRYEVATDNGFSNIIFSGLDTQFDELVTTAGSITRYLRAIGILEKPSAVVSATSSNNAPNPPTGPTVVYDGQNLEWGWTASTSPRVLYYEITNSTGTVVLHRTPSLSWIEPQIRGTASYSRRVYTVDESRLRSTSFLTLGFTIPAPNAPSSPSVTFDTNSGLIKWGWVASSSVDVEAYVLTDTGAILPALVANKNATTIGEPPTDGRPNFTRNITAVSTNGQSSSAVSATFTAPTPATPTISINRAYPSTTDVTVSSSNASRAIKNTILRISTGTGGAFDANVIQTLVHDGKQDRVTVFGQASVNPTVYVKVHYVDMWGVASSYSNELTVTFVAFPSGDIGTLAASNIPNGILTAAMFASTIEPITLVTSVPSTFVTNTIYNTTDGFLYRWDGAGYVKINPGFSDNMIANSSFEQGTESWQHNYFGGAFTHTVVGDATAPEGDYVMSVPLNASPLSKAVPVTPGDVYQIKMDWKASTSGLSAYFKIATVPDAPPLDATYKGYVLAGLTGLQTVDMISAGTVPTSWTHNEFEVTIPSNGRFLSVVIYHSAGTGNVLVDKVELRKQISPTQLAADSIIAGKISAGAVNAREIAAGAIRADKLAVGIGANLIANPSFEIASGTTQTGAEGWASRGVDGFGTVTQLSDAPNGDYVMRMVGNQSATYRAMAVVPGKKYLIRCRLRSPDGAGLHYFWVFQKANLPSSGFVDNTNYDSLTTLRDAVANSTITSWTSEASSAYVYTVPAGIYWIGVTVINAGGVGTLDADDFEVSPVIGGAWIADAAIDTAHIANLSVTGAKIALATITNANIANLAADKIIAATGDIGLLFADTITARDFVAFVTANTQLDGSISNSVTTITVDSTAGFPSIGALRIEEEVIYYSGKTSTTFTGCERGKSNTTAASHADNTPVVARGRGWRLNPERGSALPGVAELNEGVNIQGVPATEVQLRAINSINQDGQWRGNDRDIMPISSISYAYLEEAESDGANNRAYASIGANIDVPETISGSDTVDFVEVTIKNKFGERVGDLRYRTWIRGTLWDGRYERKYADPNWEAGFIIRFHNLYGFSAPLYIADDLRVAGWGGALWGTTPIVFVSRQDCPLELTAVSAAPDTVELRWSAAIANASTQNVVMRVKGADHKWSDWANIATGQSSSATSYTWSNANPFTEYEFYIQNTGVTKARSNIAYCLTQPQSATVTRPAPSNVVGAVASSTSIVWTWTRNATDNNDVEYSLDGGSWTSLGSASATTTTSSVSAGTTHTLRVRNHWTSGTANSAEASSNAVTTPSNNPGTNDPSNLSLYTPSRFMIRASWTNNGSVNQTIEWRVSPSGSWSTASLGAVSTYDITSLSDLTFYDVRVKATSGSNYTPNANGATISTLGPPEDDPYQCVLLDSLISLASGNALCARGMEKGLTVLTGKGQPTTITRSMFGHTSSFYLISCEAGFTLGCSPSHPFVMDMEETKVQRAMNLKIGWEVKMNVNGNEFMSKITSIEHIEAAAPVWICELDSVDHTFIANGFVVHNLNVK